MTVYPCPECNLPDYYNGQGDGIGSCDCPRKECCNEVAYFCTCATDEDWWGEDEGLVS